MTHEARGWDHGRTVAFFFSTGISSHGEDMIFSHSSTLPIHSPSSRLTPPLSDSPHFLKIHNFLQNTRNPSKVNLSQSKI
ncbi:hypothetical protein MicvaDRAFT_4671 [Microcoleus vaginatus FGP-2]|nr:hypothetical protein MicvaDRAFT_4671 [Microcoleus vaginatus FGP-2]